MSGSHVADSAVEVVAPVVRACLIVALAPVGVSVPHIAPTPGAETAPSFALLAFTAISLMGHKPLAARESRKLHGVSEAAFHFELFVWLRLLLAGHWASFNFLAFPEVRKDGSRRRADIHIRGGRRWVWELRSGVLEHAQIVAAAKQAGGYGGILRCHRVLLINFVLDGLRLAEDKFPRVTYSWQEQREAKAADKADAKAEGPALKKHVGAKHKLAPADAASVGDRVVDILHVIYGADGKTLRACWCIDGVAGEANREEWVVAK